MKINKLLSTVIALTMVCSSGLSTISAMEEETTTAVTTTEEITTTSTYGSLTYEIQDGEAIITNCDTSVTGEVIIPKEINGYKVTKIANEAFSFCKLMTSISLPDTLKQIGNQAFCLCHAITEINIPASVEKIGAGNFSLCKMLSKITVDENNQYYKSIDNVIYSKDMTELVCYPTGKEDISYIIPETVKTIKIGAILANTYLKDLTISDSVTEIEEPVKLENTFTCVNFTALTNLENIYISKNLDYLPETFGGMCNNLKNVVIPDNIKEIGNYVFYWCQALESIEMSDNVTKIGDFAFSNNKLLKDITLSKNLKSIGMYAFKDTAWIAEQGDFATINNILVKYNGTEKNVIIPKNIDKMADGAFGELEMDSVIVSSNIKEITYYGFYGNTLNNITIENGVESIGDGAFVGCKNLKSITIPKSVTNIGNFALGYATKYIQSSTSGANSVFVSQAVKLGASNDTTKEVIHGDKVQDFIIKGWRNSEAEVYANSNGFEFIPMDVDELKTIKNIITTKESTYDKAMELDKNNDGVVNVFDELSNKKIIMELNKLD